MVRDYYMDVSKKLKELRENKGFSLKELAEKCGKEVGLIKEWEEGSTVPSASDLISLSKVYGLTMDEMLYNDTETPEYEVENGTYANLPGSTEEESKGLTKAEKITLIIFPGICIVVYLLLGFGMHLWNPGWIIFLIIPIYYILILILSRVGKK